MLKYKNQLLAILFSVLLVSLSGCADYSNPDIKTETIIKGHEYIVITVDGNSGQSYVHNPDCLVDDLKAN